MGNTLSNLVLRTKLLYVALNRLLALSRSYEELLGRIKASPGLPVQNPTHSFWMDELSPISSRCLDLLPTNADVIIIGSGITGAAVARTLLEENSDISLKVVMLEAREACSGATGRNGGHIKPPLHHDYGSLKRKYGPSQAQMIIRFRLAHVEELLRVAHEDDILEPSQCRRVDSLDVYYDLALFEDAKKRLEEWTLDMPVEAKDYVAIDKQEAINRFHLSPRTAGVIHNQAGAIHPYRFVTSILEKLLTKYDKRFFLSTHTPCISISPPSANNPYYTAITPFGEITAPHIVHATNAWTSHLLEPMRGRIFPARGNMSAQRPGRSLSPSSLNGQRSWVFYDRDNGYDYLTQLPDGENELMFGGAFFSSGGENSFGEIGNPNDNAHNPHTMIHLAGSLPQWFGEMNWGVEAAPNPTEACKGKWFDGRVKALWSGIIGVSADGLPWVGRLPPELTGRKQPSLEAIFNLNSHREIDTALGQIGSPGEWVAAGYTGEGMVHAFMSGKALAYMVLGREEAGALSQWFPQVMRVSLKRWEEATVEKLLDDWER